MAKTFTDKAYEVVKKVPAGRVATYGQVAKLVGSPKAARAVGNAMKNNPDLTTVPCHRVVGASGALTGYAGPGGVGGKRQLLEKEGVVFRGKKVDLAVSAWQRS